MTTLTHTDFDAVRELVYGKAAIVLEPGKEYLVEARLRPLAQRHGLASVEELVGAMHAGGAGALRDEIVDAMTTNETSWFRDFHPFETLRTVLVPRILEQSTLPTGLNVWCAACSSGQEPYSVALTLLEHFPELASGRARILASDLSDEMLRKAESAEYSEIEMNRGLPAELLVRYFEKKGLRWTLKPAVRELVRFQKLNLVDPWPKLPTMDLIFLRNVLIYFDRDTKLRILEGMSRVLSPSGYLLLGGSESAANDLECYELVQHGRTACYRLRGAGRHS